MTNLNPNKEAFLTDKEVLQEIIKRFIAATPFISETNNPFGSINELPVDVADKRNPLIIANAGDKDAVSCLCLMLSQMTRVTVDNVLTAQDLRNTIEFQRKKKGRPIIVVDSKDISDFMVKLENVTLLSSDTIDIVSLDYLASLPVDDVNNMLQISDYWLKS